jgi:hypothetical protein
VVPDLRRESAVVRLDRGEVQPLHLEHVISLQATLDDDGTDLPYAELDIDYSESFLFNEVNSTRPGGALQTKLGCDLDPEVWEASSLARCPGDGQCHRLRDRLDRAGEYKDPMTRITSITLLTDTAAVAEAVFKRAIGDKVRILRSPPRLKVEPEVLFPAVEPESACVQVAVL